MGQLNLLLTLDLFVSKNRNTVYTAKRGLSVVVGGRCERGMETSLVQENALISVVLFCYMINTDIFFLLTFKEHGTGAWRKVPVHNTGVVCLCVYIPDMS